MANEATEYWNECELYVKPFCGEMYATRSFDILTDETDPRIETFHRILEEQYNIVNGSPHPLESSLRAVLPERAIVERHGKTWRARIRIHYLLPPRIDRRADIRRRWAGFNRRLVA